MTQWGNVPQMSMNSELVSELVKQKKYKIKFMIYLCFKESSTADPMGL